MAAARRVATEVTDILAIPTTSPADYGDKRRFQVLLFVALSPGARVDGYHGQSRRAWHGGERNAFGGRYPR